MRNRLLPQPHVVGKNWEKNLGSEESQPHTRLTCPGFSARKISLQNFWL